MKHIKFFPILLVVFYIPLDSYSICSTTLQCLALIEQNTKTSSDSITENLEPIKKSTETQKDGWNVFLTKYLKLNYDPENNITNDPLVPATPNLLPNIFKTLYDNEKTASLAAITDTQLILDQILSNKVDAEKLLKNEFANITPNLIKQPTGPFAITTNQESKNSSLNIQTLLAKNVIEGLNSSDLDSESGLAVKNLILFLSSSASPEKVKTEQGTMKNEEWQQYLSKLWQNTALRSITISNLYEMMRMREPIKDLGKEVGLTDSQNKPINDASILQVEEHLINKRNRNINKVVTKKKSE